MPVRYYVDADTLGLAKVMASLRWDVTYPGDPGGTVKRHSRPSCPITSADVDDDEWIPIVAANDWAIINSRHQHFPPTGGDRSRRSGGGQDVRDLEYRDP